MLVDAAIAALLAGGVFFQLVAAVGFVRFPDVYCRLHVTCINDTLGGPLVLLAAALFTGATLASAKLVLAVALLYLTSPLVGHLLSRAALEAGVEPVGAAAPPRAARAAREDRARAQPQAERQTPTRTRSSTM